MESYHVPRTHPQIPTGGAHDLCTKHDAFENYRGRLDVALENAGIIVWEAESENGKRPACATRTSWLYEHIGDGVVQVTIRKA